MSTEIDSILVVGGCGFLGHHIVSQILQSKPSLSSNISVLDLRTIRNRLPGVSYFDGDITSATAVESVLQATKPAVIIHTASPVVSKSSTDLYEKVNINGTQNLLECAGKMGVKAFVYTSSASVVHDSVSDLENADESFPILRSPQQKELYSHTKGVADDLVRAANRKHGMLTVSIRPAGIFGEGDVQMIPGMLKAYYEGKHKYQLGRNTNPFDFTYVGNVAHAHILAAKQLLAESKQSVIPTKESAVLAERRIEGEAFFVTNDEPRYFWDFARAVWRVAGDTRDPKRAWIIPKSIGLVLATLFEWIFWLIFFGTKEPSLTRQKVKYSCMTRTYRIDKIKARLGYRPQVELDDAIKRSVQWFLKESPQEKKEK